jgi:acyl CoA:acetate/3-ketoacid CoA transferase
MFSDLAPGVDPSAAILNIPEVSAAVSAALKAI